MSQRLSFSELTCGKAASPHAQRPVCQQHLCPLPVCKAQRSQCEKGTDCSCPGSHLESCEVVELFGPDLVVTCNSANFFQKVWSDTIILSGISRLMNASQSLVLDQQPSRGAFRNANSGAHSRPLGLETLWLGIFQLQVLEVEFGGFS